LRICPDKLGYQCHPSEWGDIDNFSGTKKNRSRHATEFKQAALDS